MRHILASPLDISTGLSTSMPGDAGKPSTSFSFLTKQIHLWQCESKLKEMHQRLPGCIAAASTDVPACPETCQPLIKGVIMGVLDKLFGRQSGNKRELIAKLDSVDFIQASKNIEYTFEILGKQAQQEDSLIMIKKEMLIAVGNYIEEPSLERAITLIEQYPSYLPMFESTKNPIRKLN